MRKYNRNPKEERKEEKLLKEEMMISVTMIRKEKKERELLQPSQKLKMIGVKMIKRVKVKEKEKLSVKLFNTLHIYNI